MSDDFSSYANRRNITEAAVQAHNYAGQKLENARIHERLAELKSQHDPLASLIATLPNAPYPHSPEYTELREAIYAAAFFVVIGRFPNLSPGEKPKRKELKND